MRKFPRLRVVFSALDWGLGHTTRSLPLFRALLEEEVDLVFAGSPIQREWVNAYFPEIDCLDLPGYPVRYSRTARGLLPRLMVQLPGFWNQVKKERAWLKEKQKKYQWDGLISDNRYGFWHPEVESVFITHQLRIQTPWGSRLTSWVQQAHYRWMRPFDHIWVVDQEESSLSLAGDLSHPSRLPPGCEYIGWLSAMEPNSREANPQGPLLILLSGPEPQRSMLSDLLWDQVQAREGGQPIWFVEGNPEAPVRKPRSRRVQHWTHWTAEELNQGVAEAERVICRSGYSTIMDLLRMGKPGILLPTPGQTEQEYLGRRLKALSWFSVFPQQGFCLDKALEEPPVSWPSALQDPQRFNRHRIVVRDWVRRLRMNRELGAPEPRT